MIGWIILIGYIVVILVTAPIFAKALGDSYGSDEDDITDRMLASALGLLIACCWPFALVAYWVYKRAFRR